LFTSRWRLKKFGRRTLAGQAAAYSPLPPHVKGSTPSIRVMGKFGRRTFDGIKLVVSRSRAGVSSCSVDKAFSLIVMAMEKFGRRTFLARAECWLFR